MTRRSALGGTVVLIVLVMAPVTRASSARPAPKHAPVADRAGQVYGMDMARHVTGGGPWSGLIP